MPAERVEVLHDDGRWYEAQLLSQNRRDDGWWCVVRFSTAPGSQYQYAVPAERCRPIT
jgi:1,4-alpha-glucan branching enzyme